MTIKLNAFNKALYHQQNNNYGSGRAQTDTYLKALKISCIVICVF